MHPKVRTLSPTPFGICATPALSRQSRLLTEHIPVQADQVTCQWNTQELVPLG